MLPMMAVESLFYQMKKNKRGRNKFHILLFSCLDLFSDILLVDRNFSLHERRCEVKVLLIYLTFTDYVMLVLC